MGVPGMPGLRFDVSETGPWRWVRNANQVIAGGALDLPAGMARVALQGLITVGTVELKFIRIHRAYPNIRLVA